MFTGIYILSCFARLIVAVAISYYLVYHRNIDQAV
jgi:hypothetical protein